MLYLDQTRNRRLFMAVTITTTALLMAVVAPGINVVGIMLAAATINIIIYYAMPDRYSKAYMQHRPGPIDWLRGKSRRLE